MKVDVAIIDMIIFLEFVTSADVIYEAYLFVRFRLW